jgi:WD40 repeat protein
MATCSNGQTVRIWELATGRELKSFPGHKQNVYWVEFSPDDKLISTASQDGTARIWDVASGALKHTLMHGGEVSAASFVAGGKQLATVCHDGQCRIWNVATGELDVTLPVPEPRQPAVGIGQSRNGKFLATGNYRTINLWSVADWSHIATLPGRGQHIWGLAVTDDGKKVISSTWDNVVSVWDVATQAETLTMPLPPDPRAAAGPVRAMAVSPDGTLLALSCEDRVVLLRERATGKLLRTLSGPEDVIAAIAFSPDGLLLAAASADVRGHVWDVTSGELKGKTGGHEGGATCLAWTADSRTLATAGNDHTVRLWDGRSLKEVGTLEGHIGPIRTIAFSPDGSRLISGGDDQTPIVWDIKTKAAVGTLEGHAGAVRAVGVSPDGTTVASAGDDKVIRLWDLVTLKQRAAVGGHNGPVHSLAFSPGGKTLASGAAGGGVHLIDPIRGTVRKTQTGHSGIVTGIAFLADGSGFVSSGMDQAVRFWKAAPPPIEPLVSLPAHGELAYSACYSPNGKYLATGGKDGLIALRNPKTGEIVRTLKGHNGIIYDIAFPPDSAVLASAGSDGTVRLWSVERGEELGKFNAWNDKLAAARTVDFDPAGKTIVSGAWDGTLKLWDVDQRKPKRSLIGQALPVTSAKFSPDGSIIATASGDWQQWQLPGELRLWDAKTGEELASLPGHTTEIKQLAFDRDGKRLASSGAGQVFVWDVATRSIIQRLKTDGAGTSLCFLPDGPRLAIGDGRGGVTLWNTDAAKIIERYAGHAKIVSGIAASPDGKLLATAAHDGTVKIWPVPLNP